MSTLVFDTIDTNSVWRRAFDYSAWCRIAVPRWKGAKRVSGSALEWIDGRDVGNLWSDPECLFSLVDGLLDFVIASALPSAQIQVRSKPDQATPDWLCIEISDRSAGRDDDWGIPAELRSAAKHLEGHIDVAVESGRTTTCSLSIPTGTLQGWFRRNRDRRFVYAFDSLEGRWLADRERRLQAAWGGLGSLHRLNDQTYLLACRDHPTASMLREPEHRAALKAEVRPLGSMAEFVQRLDRAVRIDAPHEPIHEPVAAKSFTAFEEKPLRQPAAKADQNKPLRPRRVTERRPASLRDA